MRKVFKDILIPSLSAFCIYVCTYAFRKGFAANTYAGQSFWGLDYKVLLVIAQIVGYASSKFIGVRFIAEVRPHQRIRYIILLVAVSWLSLALLALLPIPLGVLCMFVNGIPLGLIWGLIYSYIEGRRNTELMGAILCTSFIFSTGFVKSIGQSLLQSGFVSQDWMPFVLGALFFIPLVIFALILDKTPPPDAGDLQARSLREPMFAADRRVFLSTFAPGIVFTIILYVSLTVMRDMRDYFEVEIWRSLVPTGFSAFIFTRIDGPVSICILVMMSLLIAVRNNYRAFQYAHALVFAGFLIIGLAVLLFSANMLSVMYMMYAITFGLYLAYVPYSILFFDRLIALFRIRGNVGFLIYFADSIGYTGSVAILLYRQFGSASISWGHFFLMALSAVSLLGIVCITCSYRYFTGKYLSTPAQQPRSVSSSAG